MVYAIFTLVNETTIAQWEKLPKKQSEGVRFC